MSGPRAKEQVQINRVKLIEYAEPELREPESIDEHATSKMQSQQKFDDEDSDSSEWSRDSLPVSHDRDTHPQPNRNWTRIERNIHRLYMQARLNEDGENDMQTRIERFKNKPGQNQVYELFKTMAREKVEHQFPRSPLWMQERIAESFARRRMRFEYLKHHQEKLACGLHHESPPQPQNDPAGTTLTPFPETDTQVNKPDSRNTTPRAGNRSVILSATENTRLDTISSPRAQVFPSTESVASLTMRHDDIPYRPKLQESDTFTCPYCFLVIPSTEAEGISWR